MADGMKQVMAVAVLEVNTRIKDSYGCKWASEGMQKLAMRFDTACVANSQPLKVQVAGDVPIALPPECITVTQVWDEEGRLVKRYRVDNRNRLYIALPGKYSVDYVTMPRMVRGLDEDPEINPLYWDALGVYIAWRHLKNIGAEADYQERLEQEFWEMAEDVNFRLLAKKRQRFIPVRRWR